ncbi:MAG TPA: hypothetical protein VIL85_03165 [Thermomicrobiales bacterium]|jgi:hypothetical protein
MVTIGSWQIGRWQPGNSVLTAQLREALARPGCSLCRVETVTTRHHLEALLDERVTLPDAHHALLSSRGFCGEHTWALPPAALAAQSSRGAALLYAPLLLDLLRHWTDPGGPQRWFLPDAPCPLCRILVSTAPAYRAELAHLLRQGADDALAAGLCLPHLRLMTPHVAAPIAATLAAAAERARAEGSAHARLALLVGAAPPPLPAERRCPVCAAAATAARDTPETTGLCRAHTWARFAEAHDVPANVGVERPGDCPACRAAARAADAALATRQPAYRLCLGHLAQGFGRDWLEPDLAFWSIVQLQRDLTRYIDGGKATFTGTLTAAERRSWLTALARFGGEVPGVGLTPAGASAPSRWFRWRSQHDAVAV